MQLEADWDDDEVLHIWFVNSTKCPEMDNQPLSTPINLNETPDRHYQIQDHQAPDNAQKTTVQSPISVPLRRNPFGQEARLPTKKSMEMYS